jgi:hypothetical protein
LSFKENYIKTNNTKPDFVLFSSYKYFSLDDEPFIKRTDDEGESCIISQSLIDGFTRDNDPAYVHENNGKSFILTVEESYAEKPSLSFEEFKKFALNLKIIHHNEDNIVVKVVNEQTVEIIMALMGNPKFYKDNLFLFKMYTTAL